MDESLSDFQEKKKSCSGPKSSQIPKAKPKKKIKHIKGQKDIRSILKAKKNELVAYANDFDKICKQSGLDVDTEQLQTAIALSKSLQQTENFEENTPQSSKALSSQERISKIRTTLQEYGFKVPDIKITETKSRKLKRSRKSYKLLLTTDIEKQQIISDRYSQVLFQNLDCSKQVVNKVEPIQFCYEIATRIAYEQIRDNETFYIDGLIKRYPNSVGSLLRDWSKIPGRPPSPKTEHSEVVFSDINCNQEELDCVLSGCLKHAQDLIKKKHNLINNYKKFNITEDISITSQEIYVQGNVLEAKVINPTKMEVEIITIDDYKQSTNNQFNPQESRQQSDVGVINNNTPTLLMTPNTHQVGCCSPDIFDDEVSTTMDNSRYKAISLEIPKDSTNIDMDVMDLTECVQRSSKKNLNVDDYCIKEKSSFQLSQDKTKRKSNDFMELTTIVGSSQPLKLNNIEENIDLTQNSDHENDLTVENNDLNEKYIEMDLTQSSDSSGDLPNVQIGGTQTLDDTVIIGEKAYSGIDEDSRNCCRLIDNSDNNTKTNVEICINKELEKVSPNSANNPVQATCSRKLNSFNACNPLNEAPFDSKNYIINNEVHSITLNSSSDSIENESMQSRESFKVNMEEEYHQSKSQSFFEEFVHPHSDEPSKETEDLLDVNHETLPESNNINDECTASKENIDLTQSPGSSLVLANVRDEENGTHKISSNISNFGKIDNVSIDYDEIFVDNFSKHSTIPFKNSKASTSIMYDITDESSPIAEKCGKDSEPRSSQASEVFEISDKEFDYSMHKSMLEIDNPCGYYDFGGISVVDNLSDLRSIRQSINLDPSHSLNHSHNNSYRPFVDNIGSIKENISKENDSKGSPCSINQVLNIDTPTNGGYIIKTDQITPKLNYESMTTPERNRELNKYGLKPLKRKRGKLIIN